MMGFKYSLCCASVNVMYVPIAAYNIYVKSFYLVNSDMYFRLSLGPHDAF